MFKIFKLKFYYSLYNYKIYLSKSKNFFKKKSFSFRVAVPFFGPSPDFDKGRIK